MFFRPKVTWGPVPTELLFMWSQKLWDYKSKGVGGHDESASGVPESLEIRRDQVVKVTLRFQEDEWDAIRLWLEWAQANMGTSFTFDFSQDAVLDGPSAYEVYLIEPAMGDDIEPERDETAGMFMIDLTFRLVDGSSTFTTKAFFNNG